MCLGVQIKQFVRLINHLAIIIKVLINKFVSMQNDQRRLSFEGQSWFRKHRSKSNKASRVSNWVANKQLDSRKKANILDETYKLESHELMELSKELTKNAKNQRPGIDRRLIKYVITHLKFHFENKEFMEHISKLLEYKYFTKDSIIVKHGENFPFLCLLLEGKCQIISSGSTMTVSGEAVFGQNQLFDNQPSKTTIKCKSACEFLVLKRQDFILQKAKAQNLSSKSIFNIFCKIPLFRGFREDQLHRFSKGTEIVRLQEKGDVVKQGKKHQYFYIIIEGQFVCTEIVSSKEKTLVKLQKFDIINFQGIFNKPSVLNVKSLSEETQLYKLTISNFLDVFADSPKLFRDGVLSKISLYKDLSVFKGRQASPPKASHSSHKNFKTFISEVQDNQHPGFFKQAYSEILKVKKSLFSNVKRSSSSSINRNSGCLRSKKGHVIQLKHLYDKIELDQSKSNQFMLQAYKQKIQTATHVELDVQNRLYAKPHFFKKVREENSEIHKNDAIMSSFHRLSHHGQRSDMQSIRARTGEGSRRQDTETLLKRVQMSSCRKRRNRTKVMFDPQEIVDFSQSFAEHKREMVGLGAGNDYIFVQ